mmetsp:Transcript_44866/g.105244  ORF Transcript_44866/g.105244 Transcript_44866/m.105244 type:complete len:114 (-) Transcript_44866:18-359(-)|eukprot:CAMPEP_0177728332 /NCGR_PEP_ID=MMETSP0484_2-20121128/20827_1 /TAXON_ID=354590 /ORGANISM="Rhodomonas lens, Strain RHODO" /LENGTH=113 /DNA_ID=CAMNT_0019241103 /DNA_START=144 /DNA_END=485 /DNA_ORIENTATION=-
MSGADEEFLDQPKLETTAESTDFSTTFVIRDEDHTLGNSLRICLNNNPKVTFCGYSVPHPLENKLHLHIQTKEISASEALKSALREVMGICDHVGATFEAAEDQYYREGGTGH